MKTRPREFFLTWINKYVDGKLVSTTQRIFEDPDKDMLENNGVHTIEYAVYRDLLITACEMIDYAEAKSPGIRKKYSAELGRLVENLKL